MFDIPARETRRGETVPRAVVVVRNGDTAVRAETVLLTDCRDDDFFMSESFLFVAVRVVPDRDTTVFFELFIERDKIFPESLRMFVFVVVRDAALANATHKNKLRKAKYIFLILSLTF